MERPAASLTAAGRFRAERGSNMRVIFRWLGAVFALLFLASAPVMGQLGPTLDARAWVKQHDRNGDGKLDREEFHKAVVEAFFFRDKDKRGYLMIEELKEASPEALKAVRRKADGRITLQEYVNAMFKDFEAADTDHDGLLSVEEIENYIRSAR
jgi:Ca2+-binding EF-hand superfamily protein